MTSTFASPPPPYLFGSRDLRAHARKFFERALLLSLVVHLSTVLIVRTAVERRGATASEGDPGIPVHVHTVDVIVTPPPLEPNAGASQAQNGIFTPRPGDDPPLIDVSKPGAPDPGPGATPSSVTGTRDGSLAVTSVDSQVLYGRFHHAETQPVPLLAPIPPYPDWMREAQIEGRVLLKVLVGTDGLPKQIVLVTGAKVLGEEASKTLWRWTFRPGTSNGQPVEVWTEIPVSYRLER